jgi:hypothetical protein
MAAMTERASGRLRLAFVLGALLLLAAGFGLATVFRGSTRDPTGTTPRTSRRAQLLRSLRLADQFHSAGGYPLALSLVGSLQTADPSVAYEALASPVQLPSPHMIGVYSSDSTGPRNTG